MHKLKQFLNSKIETLFQAALKQNKLALGFIKITSVFFKMPYGIWLFRKGDISGSLKVLSQLKKPNYLAKRCIKRCEDINHYMAQNIENVADNFTPNKTRKVFNNKVMFALHSNGFFHPNGYASRTHNIINALKTKNINVRCINRLGYPWDLAEAANTDNIDSIGLNNEKFYLTKDPYGRISGPESEYIDAYAKLLEEKAFTNHSTVIHAHSSYVNGIAASKAANKLGIVSCYEVRGLWHLSRAIKEPLFNKSEHFYYCQHMELLACHLVDKVFTITETLKNWLVSKGVSEKKIFVVPNGVNNSNQLKADTSRSNDTLTLGFIGSITEYEGLDLVIQSLVSLHHLPIKLVIAGDGTYLSKLKKLSKQLGLDGSITFLGRISKQQVEQLYQQLDVIMVTRNRSALTELVSPLKHIEAFSYGVPCIVSNLPAIMEAAQHNVNCLAVTPDSTEAIKEAIKKLHNNKALLCSLTNNTRAIIESKFNWENIATTYVDAYQNKKNTSPC